MHTTLEEIFASGTLRVLSWDDAVVDALGHDPRAYYVERFWLPVLGPSTTFLLRHLALCLERSPGGCEIELGEAARRLGLGEHTGRNAPIMRTLGRCVDFEMAKPAGFATLAVRRHLPPLARRHLARLTEALLDEHARWAAAAPRHPISDGRPGPGPTEAADHRCPPRAGGGAVRDASHPAGGGGVRAGGAEAGVAGAEAGDAGAGGAGMPVTGPPLGLLRQRGRQLALSLLDLGEDAKSAERQLLRWHYHPTLARECATWAAEARRHLALPTVAS